MKFRIAFVLFFTFKSLFIFSQNGWGEWHPLYSDNDITVELQYFYSGNSCDDGGKPFKYKYRLNGYLSKDTKYISWKMNYLNCYGQAIYEQISLCVGGTEAIKVYGIYKLVDNTIYDPLNYKFICSTLVEPFYDVLLSSVNLTGSGFSTISLSKEPTEIEGNKNILGGQSTFLSVKGGVLGEGANWVWYTDQCGGNKIGTGNSIKVQPINETSYFVRAEGKNNITSCAKFTVSIDNRSASPTGIIANPNLCSGDNTWISVDGGRLGIGAEWVWYAAEGIYGNECKGNLIGKGTSINVYPTKTTTYYVRAENNQDITQCAKTIITVHEKSLDPRSIYAVGSTIICEGESIRLEVKGGFLPNNSEWKWYSSSCGGSSIASGSSVILTPLTTTTYFVRAEGFCNTTNCVSLLITVNSKSITGQYISKPFYVYKNKKANLSLNGGTLGKSAEWIWYKGECGSGKQVGTGNSITIKIKKPAHYYVRAEGLCNETNCTEIYIKPVKKHQKSSTNDKKNHPVLKNSLRVVVLLGLYFVYSIL